jgi:tetratricopeptide (TPR) repeat protein
VVAFTQGDYTQAQALHEESLALYRALGDKHGIAEALRNLGPVAHEQGDYAQAQALHEESLALYRALGDKYGTAVLLCNLGLVAHEQGDYAQARALHEESLALYRALGAKRGIAISLGNLGLVAHEQGDYAQARALHEESLALYRALGDKQGIAISLACHTALAVATERIERAVRLAGAMEALLQAQGAVLEALERRLCDTAVNTARAQLDSATFDTLWAEGQAMTLEQAIAYALGEDV